MLVNKSLFSITNPEKKQPSREVPTVLYERLGAEVSHACNQLNTVTRDLLDLTLLVPAAPWVSRPYYRSNMVVVGIVNKRNILVCSPSRNLASSYEYD